MVYRKELTYDETVDILDVKYITGSTIGYTLPPGVNEITEIYLMLMSLLPKDEKVNVTVDDIRHRSDSTANKTIRFRKKVFFFTI